MTHPVPLGPTIVRADDPVETALVFADELDAELMEDTGRIGEVIDAIHATIAGRDEARRVLAMRPAATAAGPARVVTDLDSLRALLPAIERAETGLADVTAAARRRAGQALGTDGLSAGIEAARRELHAARAEVEQRRAELARQEAAWREEQSERSEAPPRGGAHLLEDSDDADDRRTGVFGRLTGARGRRSDDADDDLASDALAHVSALTERAYGGLGAGRRADDVPEAVAALRADLGPDKRLRRAEETWAVLAGDTEPDGECPPVVVAPLPEAIEAASPAVQAAGADLRRLWARWKVAWWALDRPVPTIAEAGPALDRLAADEITEITVEAWSAQAASVKADQERFEAAAAGRSEDALHAAAEGSLRPVVVLDEDDSIDEAAFEDATASLPDEVRLIVVAPPGGAA